MSKPLGGHALTALFGLMALLMSSTTQALNLDNDSDGVIYVKELLTDEGMVTAEGRSYYVVKADGTNLNFVMTLGFGSPPDISLTVRYNLSGLVFTGGSNPMLASEIGGPPTYTLRRGGGEGDNFVEFLVSGGNAREADDVLTLTVSELAASPYGPGTISARARERFGDDSLEKTASFPNAVRVMSGVMTTYKPMSPMALVETSFLSFSPATAGGAPRQMASVGSVQIALAEDVSTWLDGDDGMAFDGTLATLINTGALDADGSSVTFSGDFSFASKVTLDNSAGCTTDGGDLLQRDEDSLVTNTMETAASIVTAFEMEMFLCIRVLPADDEDAVRIPDTDPYMVTVNFMSPGTGTQALTPATQVANLGAIMRDGTTIRLPYLTQFETYNQRIVIVNRGPAARYEFAFTEEDGVTAMPGSDAEGMLPAGETTYISLRFGDLVTLEGDFPRVSATLIVESEPRHIDVSVSQTNANGGTSIETYSKTFNN